MRARQSVLLAQLCAVAVFAAWTTGCSDDDDGTGPNSTLVGTWNATSFVGLGQDFVALGMDLTITLTSSGSYTFVVVGDLVGACSPGPNCTETGTYTATATQITLDPGTPDAETFNYSIQGTTLTFTGAIDGNPVTITFTRG